MQVAEAQRITFYKDVAPVIHANCTPCHRPGGMGPFKLVGYEDVAKRADFIKEVTQSRYMPPWKPDPHYRSFAGERMLSEEEIRLIAGWVDDQMPRGKKDISEEEVLAAYEEGTQYHRKPDLTLMMDKPFVVPGDNRERFIVFKIPFELDEARNVEAVEFVSDNKSIIHHANFGIHPVPDPGIDLYGTSPHVNLTDSSRYQYNQYLPYKKEMTYYGGWIPGTVYEDYPDDIGWIMPARGVMLLTIHFAPLAKASEQISGVNFFFKDTPVKRTVKLISIGSAGIGEAEIEPFFIIEPDTVKTFRVKVTTPGNQSVVYVWPHMHLLGKEFKAWAVSPAGDTIPLVHIPEWDFRWQDIYKFKKLVKIPAGSVLTVEGTYDNTEANPDNPFHPPRLILSGGDMRTTEEMLTLIMVFLPYQEGDEHIALD